VRRSTAAILLLLLSCTEQAVTPQPKASETPVASPTESAQPPPRATIRLVSDDDPSLGAYAEGVRFAVDEVAARGELDLRLLQAPSVDAALSLNPAAVVSLGNAPAIVEGRSAIEAARIPVILMGGDLYTPRSLFRYAFQTSVPYRWQAGVIAKYLVVDRGYEGIAIVNEAGVTGASHDEMTAALAEEGAAGTSLLVTIGPEATARDAAQAAAEAEVEAVFFHGTTAVAAALSRELGRLANPPQLALSADALDVSFVTKNRPLPGTVACYTYAWSGWADMLPRVRDFRERFSSAVAHYPASLEQEGYDAVMAIADALVRTGGEGGDRLVQELETFRDETYASVPVRLGPDDHVFAEQSHLGLFAVEEPLDAALPPPETSSLVPWRPILRTFTTDGEKVNFLDRDKKIFFPFWEKKRPTPKYWRAEYGIVSRSSDPLH
jgi:ABC-type branched-subunit amino acid transport system substrate-binding protein